MNRKTDSFWRAQSMSDKPKFRYRAAAEKGRPVHEKTDSFYAKHPPMALSRRAKIFSSFDALKGFSDELAKVVAKVQGK